ncbi:hypothetical protein [Nakamurella leprariae]|uniref:Uncharacterized protein n=1 Tax=Nakamurella leprariae TaxID=2803911 RepID=A0A939BYT8_9ACTN|nr:hypothetical protein [Nakamurella leprariae]MBM9466976.1 hypothetical protein [Nakamurella leprariae]
MVWFAIIHLGDTALLVLPTGFLWYGAPAIGARAGWSVEDPTANDGEEYTGVPLGLVGWAIVMAMTAGLVAWLFSQNGPLECRSGALCWHPSEPTTLQGYG